MDDAIGPFIIERVWNAADGTKALKEPDWSRLALWDEMRSRYAGIPGPDPVDRFSTGFRHD